MKKTITLLQLLIISLLLNAQENNSLDTTYRKNIIKWNVTPIAIIGPKSIVMGYERAIKSRQSLSINLGYLETAPLKDADGIPIKIFDQSSKGGFDISIDYRFYNKKRNINPAPDGLYWGPYLAYYNIWQDASLNLFENNTIKNSVHYKGNFSMFSAGVQLGYQFIFKKHFTLDLIFFGPSIAYYNLDLELRFKYDINPDDPFYEDLKYFLEHSNSALANLIRNQELNSSGRLSFAYYGFRYSLQLGYNF